MTFPRNRIHRKNARRIGAMGRLQHSLDSGIRFVDKITVKHDPDSRKAAMDELNRLTLLVAQDSAREGLRTKKDRSGRVKFK